MSSFNEVRYQRHCTVPWSSLGKKKKRKRKDIFSLLRVEVWLGIMRSKAVGFENC